MSETVTLKFLMITIRAIGATVVFIPSFWYLIQPQINKKPKQGHGHEGGGHEGHEDHDEGPEDAEEGEKDEKSEQQKSGEENSSKEDSGGQQGGDEQEGSKSSDSESGEEQQDTSDTSDNDEPENVAHEKEGGQNVEGVQFKGATKGGSKEGEQGDTRKHIPDAKGFSKKRIESDYGNQQGEAQNPEQDPSGKDMVSSDCLGMVGMRKFSHNAHYQAAASKPVGDKTTQSGKQEGLSNTNTKHSTDITNDPNKSNKGEGSPETSKSKGTVDPQRPQV